jgi:hypothetical protein
MVRNHRPGALIIQSVVFNAKQAGRRLHGQGSSGDRVRIGNERGKIGSMIAGAGPAMTPYVIHNDREPGC